MPSVAASIAYGCSLHCLWLQALARREAEVASLRGMLLIADADVAALGEFHGLPEPEPKAYPEPTPNPAPNPRP